MLQLLGMLDAQLPHLSVALPSSAVFALGSANKDIHHCHMSATLLFFFSSMVSQPGASDIHTRVPTRVPNGANLARDYAPHKKLCKVSTATDKPQISSMLHAWLVLQTNYNSTCIANWRSQAVSDRN